MTERQKWNRQVWLTALLTVGLAAALVFGIVVLASGDWLPGTIIVAASIVALAGQARTISRLCSSPVPGPPKSTPSS